MRLPRFARNDREVRLPRFARNDIDMRLHGLFRAKRRNLFAARNDKKEGIFI